MSRCTSEENSSLVCVEWLIELCCWFISALQSLRVTETFKAAGCEGVLAEHTHTISNCSYSTSSYSSINLNIALSHSLFRLELCSKYTLQPVDEHIWLVLMLLCVCVCCQSFPHISQWAIFILSVIKQIHFEQELGFYKTNVSRRVCPG